MKNPILMSGRMGSPIQQSYSPIMKKKLTDASTTDSATAEAKVDHARQQRAYDQENQSSNVDDLGTKESSGIKKREQLTDASTVDSATAEAKHDHARQQRSYDAENQSSNVDDLGTKESSIKNRPIPRGMIKGLKKLYDVYRRYKHRLDPPKGGGPGRKL